MKNKFFGTILVATSIFLSFCATETKKEEVKTTEKIVNIYTHRHYDVDQLLFDQFEKETGIKVNIVKASADELLIRLEAEGANSPADLFVTVDAGRLVNAVNKGLLQPIQSEILNENIPSYLRDQNGYWFGQTIRARVIAYSKKRVKPKQLSTYANLAEAQWKNRILCRPADSQYNQSLIASFIANDGEEFAQKWTKGIVNNMARPPKGNDTDQMVDIAAGVGDIALVNTYYYGKLITSDDSSKVKAAQEIGIFFPTQNSKGTHINISGAGIPKFAPHKENGIKLLEFLSSTSAQKVFAEANFEYPVNPEVETATLLKDLGTFQQDSLDLNLLGKYNKRAVEIMDIAGWK
jgi:iron(III) transport system substrate-binding protein